MPWAWKALWPERRRVVDAEGRRGGMRQVDGRRDRRDGSAGMKMVRWIGVGWWLYGIR